MTLAHRLRRLIAAPMAGNPFLLQRLRWPNPLRPPYLQREINLFRPGELGDVVMCLAVVHAIRRRNPSARITFITHQHELLRGHPLIDRVLSVEAAQREPLRRVISLRYEVFVPLRLHMIDYLAGCVGLREIEHTIPLPDFTAELGPLRARLPEGRRHIVICRNAGPFTPNKQWPEDRWDQLVENLRPTADVIEVGVRRGCVTSPRDGYTDLRGETSVRQYCAVISLADLVISPPTSAVHIAAAYGVPALSIIGGYERPENSAYPLHASLYREVPCAPCWLTTPCRHDRMCLRQISVDEVATVARRMLAARPARLIERSVQQVVQSRSGFTSQ